MRRYAAYAGLAALLLIGAGCDARTEADVNAGAEIDLDGTAPTDENGNDGAMIDGRIDVDGAIDAIQADMDAEAEANAGIEANADEVETDRAQLDAYGSANYELQ